MGEPPQIHLLDVSRLASRAGRGPFTGIDRVELAYLDGLLARPGPAFALARSAPGFALLDRDGMAALRARLSGAEPWGKADPVSRLHLRQPAARRRVMSDLRKLAVGYAVHRALLPRLLRRHLPAGIHYLNAGHTNLSPHVFAALRAIDGARIKVLIHDTIPVDYPEYTREGLPARFAAALRLVGEAADLAIYNSRATRRAAERHFGKWGRVPPALVAHLGVTRPQPDRAALAGSGVPVPAPGRPYFVALGTIEPRKNHALLLDIWEDLARQVPPNEMPALCIVGARGWRNADVLARLDAGPLAGRDIFEMPGLGDGAVGALLSGARALLFPSHAEGFGLPAVEAAALGVPVVCNDLPVFREILGDYPVYAAVDDRYLWSRTIRALSWGRTTQAGRRTALAGAADAGAAPPKLPGWEAHIHSVLSAAC